jgi:ParB-like chromosome segregation protein Spo0J
MGADVMTDKWLQQIGEEMERMCEKERIENINALRVLIAEYSPFRKEPSDCIQWIRTECIEGNDYNPNTVAQQEIALLIRSLESEGFTHPLVVRRTKKTGYFTLIDGFHRHQICSTNNVLRERFLGYVPVVILNGTPCRDASIAATVRHNRARGRHQIQSMSELVKELVLLGWEDKRIAIELGMEQDEVLRLKQLNGLLELFSARSYSQAWTV